MSIFGSIWRAATGPLKAIGNVARGRFRQAIGNLGDTMKLGGAALGVTGVGAPLAMGVSALGGAAQEFGKGESIGGILKGAAGGASAGAAGAGVGSLLRGGIAGNLGKGIGNALRGGTPAPAAAAVPGTSLANVGGEIAPRATGLAPIGASGTAPSIGANVGGEIAKNVGSEGGGLMNWIKGINPTVATGAMSTAANMIGAQQQGKMMDRQFQFEREDRDRMFRLQQMREMLGMYGMGLSY